MATTAPAVVHPPQQSMRPAYTKDDPSHTSKWMQARARRCPSAARRNAAHVRARVGPDAPRRVAAPLPRARRRAAARRSGLRAWRPSRLPATTATWRAATAVRMRRALRATARVALTPLASRSLRPAQARTPRWATRCVLARRCRPRHGAHTVHGPHAFRSVARCSPGGVYRVERHERAVPRRLQVLRPALPRRCAAARGARAHTAGLTHPRWSNALPFARRRSQRRTTTRRAAAQRHARARARAGVTQLFHRPLPTALAAIRHCCLPRLRGCAALTASSRRA